MSEMNIVSPNERLKVSFKFGVVAVEEVVYTHPIYFSFYNAS